MGWSLPYGYVWGPNGTVVKDDSGAGEYGSPSAAPDQIGTPPVFLDDNENIYKDEAGVIRNRKQGGGGGRGYGPGSATGGGTAYGGQGFSFAGGDTGGGGGGGSNLGGGSSGAAGSYGIRGQYSGMGGGGRMGASVSTGGGIRTQYADLDRNIWNTPVNYGSAQGAAGSAGGYASGLANLEPGGAPQERTLYDRYSALLQDPSSMMQNPGVAFALQQAQQANARQMGAMRMRNSGNALRSASDATTGTLMQQFGNMANIYGGGAQSELARNQLGSQTALEQSRQKGAFLQGAGNLALGSGQLYNQTSAQGIAERDLDLRRVQSGIQSADTSYAQQLLSQARQQANAPGSYGTYSPNLSTQYQQVTGSPLSLSYGGAQLGSMFSPGYGGSYY